MSTAFNEIYSHISGAYQADNGVGGLNYSSPAGDMYIREFWRAGDTRNRNRQWPKVVVSLVAEEERDGVANGGGTPPQYVAMTVQFDVLTKADNRFVNQDAVVARMRTVFHKFTPSATLTDWTFGELVFRSEYQVPTREEDNEMRYIIRARIDGRKA